MWARPLTRMIKLQVCPFSERSRLWQVPLVRQLAQVALAVLRKRDFMPTIIRVFTKHQDVSLRIILCLKRWINSSNASLIFSFFLSEPTRYTLILFVKRVVVQRKLTVNINHTHTKSLLNRAVHNLLMATHLIKYYYSHLFVPFLSTFLRKKK